MYYPKSQITPNLYTNGGEYRIKGTTTSYVGFYFKISTNKKFIGKSPNYNLLNPPELEPLSGVTDDIGLTSTGNFITNNLNLSDYNPDLLYYNNYLTTIYPKLTDFQSRILPSPYYSKPTPKEKGIGEYRRYFAKKNNELIYLEISKETYTKFKSNDPRVASDLYNCLFLPWDLNSETTNQNIVALVEKDNKWYGFSSYFKDYFGSPRN